MWEVTCPRAGVPTSPGCASGSRVLGLGGRVSFTYRAGRLFINLVFAVVSSESHSAKYILTLQSLWELELGL